MPMSIVATRLIGSAVIVVDALQQGRRS